MAATTVLSNAHVHAHALASTHAMSTAHAHMHGVGADGHSTGTSTASWFHDAAQKPHPGLLSGTPATVHTPAYSGTVVNPDTSGTHWALPATSDADTHKMVMPIKAPVDGWGPISHGGPRIWPPVTGGGHPINDWPPITHGPVIASGGHPIPHARPIAMFKSSGSVHYDNGNVDANAKFGTDGGGIQVTGHYDHSTETGLSHGKICGQIGNPPDNGIKVCESGTWGHKTTVTGGFQW